VRRNNYSESRRVRIDDLAYATPVYSTIARGKASCIDTTEAKRANGVIEIFTYKNIPRMKAPPLVDLSDLKKGMAASDLPIMQDAKVHWDGQPVAIVVAETLEQAEHVASLVKVEYSAGIPDISFEAAKSKAKQPPDVMGEPAEIKIGDAEKALKEADAKVDHVYRTPRYNHNAIEPHASIAYWTEDGTLVVLDATQCLLREPIGGFPRDNCHLVRKGLR
jgi:xanthine dehydrogenase YagR molybdenum-binding subunit